MEPYERLGVALELRGLSQGQLAQKTDISQGHISMILSGKRDPTLSIAIRLAEALNVSLAWVAGQSRHKEELTPEEETLLQRYRAIRDEGVRRMAFEAVTSGAEINGQR